MSKRIGIFVIAYNAETTLSSVLDRIPPTIIEKTTEIFVIDDCSTDGTYKVGQSYSGSPALEKLTVQRNPVNLMYGGNQKRGYQYAIERDLDIVVLLHGDGQYAPEVMERMLEPLESGRAEMVMGSRMMIPGAARRGNMPAYKFFGNKLLSATQNWLLGSSFTEFHSGYRAYATSALRTLDFEQMTNSWHFDTQIILNFLQRGYRILEVPIPTYYGDEICHVNGVPYAFECVKATTAYAWTNRFRPKLALRFPQRSAE